MCTIYRVRCRKQTVTRWLVIIEKKVSGKNCWFRRTHNVMSIIFYRYRRRGDIKVMRFFTFKDLIALNSLLFNKKTRTL